MLAQEASLYEGEAPVADQSVAQREAALPGALAQVLVKVTGDSGADTDPAYAGVLSGAAGMMQQYRYRQDVVTADGVPQLKLTLIARFNAKAVEGVVTRAGRTLYHGLIRAAAERNDAFLACLSARERAAFEDALDKLAARARQFIAREDAPK